MLYIELAFLSLFPLLTILLSGLGLEVLLKRYFSWDSPCEFQCMRIASFGILWTMASFGTVFLILPKNAFPNYACSIIFLISTILLLGATRWVFKDTFRNLFHGGLLSYLLGFSFIAFILECLSIYFSPHVFDSAQLGWTNQFTDPESIQYGKQTGAVAYSALVFFTGLLAPNLPLVISAAAVKIVIFYLLVATIVSISRTFYGRQFMIGILIVIICILGSPLGFLTVSYGKDSILAVILELAYLIALGNFELPGRFVSAAIFSGTAALCGVISIPFTFMITALVLMSIIELKNKIAFLTIFFFLTGPLIAFPLSVMLHHSLISLIVISMVSGFFFFFVGHWSAIDKVNFPRMPFWLPALIVLASILVAFHLLPILKILPEYYGGDHGVVSPFDGKTGFLGLLYSYNCCSGFSTGVYLIAPFFALFLWRKTPPESWIPFFYLQVTLAVVLVSCHIDQKILDASNQWDLVKDSMNYFFAPTVAIILGPVIAGIPNNFQTKKSLALFFFTVFFGSLIESVSVYQMKTGEFYPSTKIGVFKFPARELEIPKVAEYFYNKGGRQSLVVDMKTGFPTLGPIQSFCPHLTILPATDISSEISHLRPAKNESLFLITRSDFSSRVADLLSKDCTTLKVLEILEKHLVLIEIISNK